MVSLLSVVSAFRQAYCENLRASERSAFITVDTCRTVQMEREQAVQTEAVAAAQRALGVVNNQYRAGTVAYLNVLSAQAQVLSAQSALIGVRQRRLAAAATLLKNVAGRWEATAPAQ